MQIISKNIKDTEKIAKEFTDIISMNKKRATVVCLFGDLGTGKTTFSQFVAKNLGVKGKVNSPTFVIMKRYVLKNINIKNLLHVDAYRLKNEKELLTLGWNNLISDKENLILIEWPERVIKAIPKKHHKILISHTKDGNRKFQIKKA